MIEYNPAEFETRGRAAYVPGEAASVASDPGVIELAREVGRHAARDAMRAWQAGYDSVRGPVQEAALWTRLPEITDTAVALFTDALAVLGGDIGATDAALLAEGADPLVTRSIAIRVHQAAATA